MRLGDHCEQGDNGQGDTGGCGLPVDPIGDPGNT
jgi:hypothetical protein